jgi:hypothetical protein
MTIENPDEENLSKNQHWVGKQTKDGFVEAEIMIVYEDGYELPIDQDEVVPETSKN